VSKVSTAEKLGVVARVARRQAGRSRYVRALVRGGTATARTFGRVLHQLWLELTGFVFLVMAASGAAALVREYGKYHSGKAGLGGVGVALCFTLAFAWFGASSFWKARQKAKSAAK